MERTNTYLYTCQISNGLVPEKLVDAIKTVRKQYNIRFSIKYRGRNENRKQFYVNSPTFVNRMGHTVNPKGRKLSQDLPLSLATHADAYVYVKGLHWKDLPNVTRQLITLIRSAYTVDLPPVRW
jgi:hypothetical protein